MGFESFLDESCREGGDPGTAMVEVLKRRGVRGIDLNRILSTPGLDPRNSPSNLLPFLRRIASDGQWGVNLSIRVS
jgi:hypothetical protein